MIKIKEYFSRIRPLSAYLSNERGIIGTTAAIIGSSVIAGAAGLGAAAISSSGARKASETAAQAQQRQVEAQQKAAAEEELRRQEALRMKQEAAAKINFPTFLETETGQQIKGTLEDRIAGRGLIDVSAQTAPVAEQVRAGLQQTQAGLASMASARGLGRSTVATAQGTQASQAAERDIAERVAQLELARQNQISTAVGRFQQLSEQEAASQQNQAKFKLGAEFNIADTLREDASAIKTNEFAIAETIQAQGATVAAGQLLNSQILASGLLAAGMSFQQAQQKSTDDLLDVIGSEQQKRNAALVNIGTSSSRTVKSASLLNPDLGFVN